MFVNMTVEKILEQDYTFSPGLVQHMVSVDL